MINVEIQHFIGNTNNGQTTYGNGYDRQTTYGNGNNGFVNFSHISFSYILLFFCSCITELYSLMKHADNEISICFYTKNFPVTSIEKIKISLLS